MRRARFALLLLALLAVINVAVPSVALAGGCGSAGDSQYFDPLQGCNSQSTPKTGHTHPSGSTTPVTTPTTPTATLASASTTAADPKSNKTLPFTGLDLAPVIVIAVALLGGGLVLRRLSADDS